MAYIKDNIIYDDILRIELGDVQIVSPTKEQILAAGYKEYDNSNNNISDLDIAKAYKINEIDKYDNSQNVNLFYYGDKGFWIDKSTRVGLKNSTQDEIDLGRTETTLILDDNVITIDCNELLLLLKTIEVYAKDCYNVTAQHKINVKYLKTIEEVEKYDYTIDYPNKLYF